MHPYDAVQGALQRWSSQYDGNAQSCAVLPFTAFTQWCANHAIY